MTITELKKAEKEYTTVMNEGGEGYNPYTEELASEDRIVENRRNLLAIFKAEWTLEITKSRRIEWNNFVRSINNNGLIENAKLYAFEDAKGYNRIDLKKAILIYKL